MVKFWSVAVIVAFRLAATTSIDAQNAAVHAPDLESRAATPAATSATASATTPKARASTTTTATTRKTAAATPSAATPKAAATTPKAAAPTPAAATPKAAATTPKAASTTTGKTTNTTATASKASVAPSPAPAADSPTWVENKIKANPKQNACYRRVSLTTDKSCKTGYTFDNATSCWSQCPLDYPVQCGFECLPQNKDCTLEIVSKASAVATTALSVATAGVFGALCSAASGAQKALACGQALFDVTTKISGEIDKLAGGTTLTTKDKIKTAISNADFVVYDVPAAIATCLGIKLPADFKKKPENCQNFINFYKSFRDFWAKDPSAAADEKLTVVTADDLVQVGQAATTCGGMVRDYIGQVQSAVAQYIKDKPTSTAEKLESFIFNLPLVLNGLPDATVNCIKKDSADGIKTRDEIVTAARLISEQIIHLAKSGTKNTLKTLDQYKLEIAQFGLDVISFWDPLKIADLVKAFLMPICTVTVYKGEIQRGTLDKALGLEAVGKAFQGSTGTWENEGDGYIYFRFKSSDTENVKLNIMSGGKKLYEWPLLSKKNMQQSLPLSTFAGKTLYIDRWRAGILNFIGTGGGSLLMWVPENTKGRIVLDVMVNPTQMGNR